MLSQGLPVEEKLVLPEYQVLYECIWLLRNPLSNHNPLLRWNSKCQKFETNPQVCLSSLMPITLASSFTKFKSTLDDLRLLHEFVSNALDRRQDPGDIGRNIFLAYRFIIFRDPYFMIWGVSLFWFLSSKIQKH